jgi:acrylyl-CoA reductase (NADPH)
LTEALANSHGIRNLAQLSRHFTARRSLFLWQTAEIVSRDGFAGTPRPLGSARWAGAIDVAGQYDARQCPDADGVWRHGRGQRTLAGIDSVMTPKQKRIETWKRLAKDLDLEKLRAMTETKPIRDAVALAPEIVAGCVKGRIVFEVESGAV